VRHKIDPAGPANASVRMCNAIAPRPGFILFAGAMRLRHSCNTVAIQLQYSCNTAAIQLQYSCNTTAIRLQYENEKLVFGRFLSRKRVYSRIVFLLQLYCSSVARVARFWSAPRVILFCGLLREIALPADFCGKLQGCWCGIVGVGRRKFSHKIARDWSGLPSLRPAHLHIATVSKTGRNWST
jgi:hypothetical protein